MAVASEWPTIREPDRTAGHKGASVEFIQGITSMSAVWGASEEVNRRRPIDRSPKILAISGGST